MASLLRTVYSIITYVVGFIRTIIAPPFCRSCKTFLNTDAILCDYCIGVIEPVTSTAVRVTVSKSIPVHAIGAYKDPLKYLILAKGWSDRTASYQLGTLLWHNSIVAALSFDCIVPVPLHWSRSLVRGFNQAQIMAQVISDLSNKPVIPLLKRIRATRYQARLSGVHRTVNVREVFAIDTRYKEWCTDKDILIIDDLMTTGATLQEIGKALLPHKPRSIVAVVAARVCI
jgi:ComF family protein